MGIFKAAVASASGMAGDQWKEFFYCDSLPEDRIMVRGVKRTSANSSNKGDQEIITDGSIIAVADGQCAIVVSNGKVISILTDPGENEFRTGETYGVFSGSKKGSFGKEFFNRLSFGGDAPPTTQRVYYLNMKVILNNPFGNGMEVPVRIHDEARGLDIDCSLIMSGVYSYRIVDPAKIYKQVIGNVKHVYMTSYLASQMKADVDSTLLSAVGEVCVGSFRPSALGSFIPELTEQVIERANTVLGELRGIEIVNLAFEVFKLTDPDTGIIRQIQVASVAMDPLMGAAMLTSAQADAMRDAASNTMGMGTDPS